MKKIILTANCKETAYDFVQHIDFSKGNKLLFIKTPSEPKTSDLTWLAEDRQSLVDVGFQVEDFTITSKKPQEIEAN